MPTFTLIPGGMPPVQPRLAITPKPTPLLPLPRVVVTRRDIHGAPLRQIGWIDYPDGRGNILQSVAHPRLTYIVRRWDDGRVRTFWLVDGQTVEGIDHALDELNRPPTLSDEEREILSLVPRDWTEPRSLRAAVTEGHPAEAHAGRVKALRRLADKGLLEVENMVIRRTPEVVA